MSDKDISLKHVLKCMEEFASLINESIYAFKTADHLAYVTYPIVTDKKLLMVVIENLHRALQRGVEAILTYEYVYKRINYLPKDFEQQLLVFSEAAYRYNVKKDIISIAKEINEIIKHREKSPIEFIRKDKFVIASEDFTIKTITIEKVKNYIQQIRYLFDRLSELREINVRRIS